MTLKTSFSPLISTSSKILILGSLPGDLSIAKQEYYAHPQNRFWKLIFRLHNGTYTSQYEVKKTMLLEQQLALWDVCASANRLGSLDTAIHSVVVNPIHELLSQYPMIQKILFNGKKAAQLYDQHFVRKNDIRYFTVPSTSPANAVWNFEKLTQTWAEAIDF